MTGLTITSSVTIGVTVGYGVYGGPLTVAKAGSIHPVLDGEAGVTLVSAILTNEGTVVGSGDLYGSAGVGVEMGGNGTLLNGGLILGGSGFFSGETGLLISSGLAENSGTIAGNIGERFSDPPPLNGLTGGSGVVLIGGSLVNNESGLIEGANGGFGAQVGGKGGYGIVESGGLLSNFGTVIGGSGGSGAYGLGGAGAYITGGLLDNDGSIFGGAGADNLLAEPSKGPGDGVVEQGGSLLNAGLIEGVGDSIGSGIGVYLLGGQLTNAGVISGAADGCGTYDDAVQFGLANAVLDVEPGASFQGDVIANTAASDELELSNQHNQAGILDMAGTFIGFNTIAFDAGSAWRLSGTGSELADGQTILGFSIGDTLELDGFSATSGTFVGGAGLELSDGGLTETLDVIGSFSTGSFIVLNQPTSTEILLCYLRGTRILTPAGEVPIETLNIGDTVITRYNGYRRIKWIGRQSFGRRFIETNRAQLPIRIAAGALGEHLPKRDLYVSPGHSMLIGNLLVLASSLINGVTITQDRCPDEVHYYQVEFDTHDCVQAEGCWSESLCDYADLRNQFHNREEFWRLYPEHVTPREHVMCAPRPDGGPALDAVLKPVVALAAAQVPLGPLQGVIDEVQPSGLVRGWALDTSNPQLPVLLELLLKGRVVANFLACDYRPDLAAAGLGRGRCSFTFCGPKIARKPVADIRIRRFGDRHELTPSPIGLKVARRALVTQGKQA